MIGISITRIPNTPPSRINDLAQIRVLERDTRIITPRSPQIINPRFCLDGRIDSLYSAIVNHIPGSVILASS